jgi:hypothetical protein
MFNAPEESSMQVDNHNYILPSTPTLPPTASVLSIPDDVLAHATDDLACMINPEYEDARILRFLEPAGVIVRKTLSHDPNLKARVATEDEFIQNVEDRGKEEVIQLFKKATMNESWPELMLDGTSFLFF